MKRDADVVIIGAGAAGLTAAQYASRSNLSTLVVEEMASGGQALIIDRLENYPGFPDPVNGQEFSQALERQAKNFGARFVFDTVTAINKKDDLFHISLAKNSISALAVIVASGARHKTLGIPGEAEFTGRGVSYCGTCDGPLFKQKRMLVVGGGDAACDEAVYLARLTDKIIHIHRRERFRAQSSLAQRVTENDHIDVRFSTECRGIFGDGKVAGVRLEEKVTNRVYEEPVDVVFIFIGSLPRTDFVSGIVQLDEGGYIVTDAAMQTKIPGLFAAGDVRDTPFRQLVVAAGEGAVAAHAAAAYIDELKGNAYR